MLPPVKGLVENSLIEWPGRISTIIFLPGCNFRCPYCHSAHLVNKPNELESVPFEAVRKLLSDRRGWIDGVVVTGGEPTIQPGLSEMLSELREMGIAIRINTNGSRPEVLQELAGQGLIDSVALDVKAPLDRRYDRLAGVEADFQALGRTVDWLLSGAVAEVEFRTTVVPQLLSTDDVIDIARRLGFEADYVLQPFRPLDCLDSELSMLPASNPEELLMLAGRARRWVRSCKVRGLEDREVEVETI